MSVLSNRSVIKFFAGTALAAASFACSPIAPSVDKSQLVERPSHSTSPEGTSPGDDGDAGLPGTPTADVKDVILYRGANGSWTFAGSDMRDWFFLSQPKPLSQTDLSADLLSEQFQDFLNNRTTQVPITMTRLNGSPISTLQASVAFETKIDARVFTPAMLAQVVVNVDPGPAGNDGTLYWALSIPSSVPDTVVKPFLAGLTHITIMTSCAGTNGVPAAGSPCGGK